MDLAPGPVRIQRERHRRDHHTREEAIAQGGGILGAHSKKMFQADDLFADPGVQTKDSLQFLNTLRI